MTQVHQLAAPRWILRNIVVPIGTILIATFVVFAALTATSGDPVSQLLGPRASAAQRAALRADLGLDDPMIVQYWHWLTGVLHGDFGTSIVFKTPVSELIASRAGTTVFLVVYASLIVVVFGLLLAIVGSVYKPMRPVVLGLNGGLVAIPNYVASFVLIAVFAVNLGWFPTSGTGSWFLDQLHHLTLPAIALALGWVAYLAQIGRAAILEEMGSEHVEAARGRGLPPRSVFWRHIMRNSWAPIVSVVGTLLAYLVVGSVIVESSFGLEGLGSFLVQSVASKDTDVVLAIITMLVVIFVVASTVADRVLKALDPRVRERSAP